MKLAPNANVLVINVSRIGDTLLATPALQSIKAQIPNGKLTVLGHPKRVSVLKHLPFIDEIGAITPSRSVFKRWLVRKNQFDVAIVYGRDLPLLRFARKAAKYTVGESQAKLEYHRYLDVVARPKEKMMHAVEQALLLPSAIGISTKDKRLSYLVSSDEQIRAKEWIDRHGLSGKTLIGLQVSSFPTKSYRDWPVHRFAELIDWLSSDDIQRRFIILGDKLSTPKAKMLHAQFPDLVVDATGEFDLRSNAALVSCLSLYVGVDTGPTHLAGALRIPMVALYHPMHPSSVYGPLEHASAILIDHPALGSGRVKPECEMSDIQVASVYEPATRLLSK
ncbi:glycosyltransferase family 9 protein [Leeia sp. TBRC 13508]|uniref:Glycosyltransferase family 9 protein n=1 Tax=Leeia speluncae TaxID=2884804 RepID=A0ABS8D5B0_9NEIS|nr:glycosyltransferase family 9 protein [Leeia speluncae]MCB6183383.1 glycosyltransferase family 9 protein [Leeia speluncae]